MLIAATALILNTLFNLWACNGVFRQSTLDGARGKEGRMTSQVVSTDFIKQVGGYGLTTAHILYRLPDHPRFLQTYVWQDYDLFPKFPVLQRFLDFWTTKLEGPLHSVTVAHSKLIKPAEIRAVDGVFRLH
jgi:uncharacterized protein Usg